MRSVIILTQLFGILGSTPGTLPLYAFISCECLEPERISTDLYRMFDEDARLVYSLFDWYKLDEPTFMRMARSTVERAHKSTLKTPEGHTLKEYMENMTARGLTEDGITTELLRKYYKSLRSKTAMHKVQEEDDEYDD
jgi:NAD-dependent DNA ligase